jgi:hypothetical protein
LINHREKFMHRYIIILLFIILPLTIYPCTNAIVTGKATVDGRPLLWKNRDTNNFQSKIMYFEDGKYPYLGLVNADDTEGKEVWVGVNEAGFAIMNSASYNLKPGDDTTKIQDREGIIMKLALQQCVSVDDFEALLLELPKPLGVEANFGVIDALGGAAFFETDNFNFRKFDVNDPEVAPHGYMISTNFSNSGNMERGHGYIRYETASRIFEEKLKEDKLSASFILSDAARSLKHSRTAIDLGDNELLPAGTARFSFFRDFIPRYTSTSLIVVRGVIPGESPKYTTMFTILGFPLTSVTVPLWVSGKNEFPGILKADETGKAPLCDAALRLKSLCFPIQRGSGTDYINLPALLNSDNTGFLQILPILENEIFMNEREFFKSLLTDGIDQKRITEFYSVIEKRVSGFFKEKFGILLE